MLTKSNDGSAKCPAPECTTLEYPCNLLCRVMTVHGFARGGFQLRLERKSFLKYYTNPASGENGVTYSETKAIFLSSSYLLPEVHNGR